MDLIQWWGQSWWVQTGSGGNLPLGRDGISGWPRLGSCRVRMHSCCLISTLSLSLSLSHILYLESCLSFFNPAWPYKLLNSQSPDQGSSEDSKEIASIKALITARDVLVKEVHKLGKGIDQTIGNLIDSNSIFEGNNLIDSYLRPAFSNTDTEVPDKIAGGTALASESRNGLEVLV